MALIYHLIKVLVPFGGGGEKMLPTYFYHLFYGNPKTTIDLRGCFLKGAS